MRPIRLEDRINALLRRLNVTFYFGTPLPVRTNFIRKTIGMHTLIKRIRDIPGSIVECGVGKGATFTILTYLAKNRHIYGFDSFQGFPPPSAIDSSERDPKAGEWDFLSGGEVVQILRATGFSAETIQKSVTIVPGFFKDTLKKYDGGNVAFLHVDVDLYESYRDVLEHFYTYMSPGGIILFDEYQSEKWPGATRAIDEFVAKYGKTIEFEDSMQRYFVRM